MTIETKIAGQSDGGDATPVAVTAVEFMDRLSGKTWPSGYKQNQQNSEDEQTPETFNRLLP